MCVRYVIVRAVVSGRWPTVEQKPNTVSQTKRVRIRDFVLRGAFLFGVWGIGLLAAASAQNPVVIENQQLGTSQWQIPWGSAGTDVGGQIKGYASTTSVNKGQNITFYVSVNPAQAYTIDVYRMGWYQGLGGRLMQHIGPLNGSRQATCPTNSTTGMIECHWAAAFSLPTQSSWTSGVYLALLTNAQGYKNYINFVVRDDSRIAALLYQQPVTTYEAYNDYPYDNKTGKSLYLFNSYGANTVTGGPNAAKVSFDRPYMGDGTGINWGQSFLSWEFAFVRWMESSGYDVSYATDVDTHVNGSMLLNYRGILSVGHDEYFSKPMYDAFIAARDAGVNLGFFGADPIGWQVRFESSSSGVPNRVMVCYRNATIDPISDPTLKTVEWLDPLLNRPEQTLVGVQYTSQVMWQQQYDGYVHYVVANSANWVYAGTGFKDGDSVAGIVGYEADRLFSQYPPPNAISGTSALLSNSPFTSNQSTPDYANSSVYQAASGAWVFAAGTMGWSRALDNYSGQNLVDPRIQQTTANILNRFIALRGDFTLGASPASQAVVQGGSTSYSVSISPTGGFSGQVTLSVSGLPVGASGSFAPNPATTSSTLSVTTSTNTPTGGYTLTITGVSGTLTHTFTVSFVVNTLVDFTLGVSPASQALVQGGSTSYSVSISPTGGSSGQVTLSVSGLPVGASGSFAPNPATTSATLSVTTSTSTPTGGYTLTVTGSSGSLTHTTAVTLVVGSPDFTLNASPSSQTVRQGGSTSYSVSISPTGGFSGQVTLSVSGLPVGASGSFAPNPATTSSTLSVTTSTSTPTGGYTLTVTGSSGSLTHTTAISLTVAVAQTRAVAYDNKASSGLQWGVTTANTPAFTIGSGTNRAAIIMVVMSANNATNITASLGGVRGTLVPGTDSGATARIRTLIFQVINPPTGSQSATVFWTTAMNVDVGVITVSGADQTTPCTNGTFVANNSNGAATTSVTITSNPGDLTASVGFTADAWATPFTNQMLKWGVDSAVAGADIGPGTGTTTHTWTDRYLYQTTAVSGVNFKAQ
jgi:N,N-dimethylformamidase beta subunit-like protein